MNQLFQNADLTVNTGDSSPDVRAQTDEIHFGATVAHGFLPATFNPASFI